MAPLAGAGLAGVTHTLTQRTVFLISYHYPPIVSGGVERITKFLRFLPEFGYRARVLTTSAFGAATGPDPGGAMEVLRAWEPVRLYRWLFNRAARTGQAPSFVRTDPGVRRHLRGFLSRVLLVPDGQVTWLPTAALMALRSLRRQRADVLFSTSPPPSAHLLGMLLKGLTGLPWVADFRDSWTQDPLHPLLESMPARRSLEEHLEERVVGAADRIVSATDIMAEDLGRAHPEAADRICVVANGFDPADFASLDAGAGGPSSGPLRLLHAGSFSASHPQRSPEPLVAALALLRDEDPSWEQRLLLVLVGNLNAAERALVAPLVDAGMAEVHPARPRADVLAEMARAHVLVVVDHPRKRPASNVPGKFFEYLAVGRPVLALCGPGMVRRMTERLQAGRCVPPDDPPAVAEALRELYDERRRGALQTGVSSASLRPYHRRELTRRLAACFDALLASPVAS